MMDMDPVVAGPELVNLMARRQHERLTLELSWLDGFMPLSELQLALRHPENRGTPAMAARAIADRLARLLGAETEPALATIIAEGWEVPEVPR